MDDDTRKLRAEYAALDVRPGEEWFAYIHKGGYDLCVESARRQADHPNAARDGIVGRFACGAYAIRCLPVIATAMNTLPTLLDTIDTLRQQLAEARALWAQMAFPSGPEHAGEMADAMDKLLATEASHD